MPEEDLTTILVGKSQVGITGLKAALAEVLTWPDRSEADIAQALYERLRERNYIPPAAREEYRQAFVNAYRQARGLPTPPPAPTLSVKIVGGGCPACSALGHAVMAALEELRLPADLAFVSDPKDIAALGVTAIPALLINGEVKAVAQTPTREQLLAWFTAAAKQAGVPLTP